MTGDQRVRKMRPVSGERKRSAESKARSVELRHRRRERAAERSA